ncbi:MAG TPA: NrfD/PsrC family molybdoenzyme membrane anchor subunit [Solirubrobacteraceae bacterium]|nr:NrfD/PsrC family molybdoenzyme membrane anchor subunit [Solirubrobacteraceae bacterium]
MPPATPRSYYGQPILNRPTWTWEVPAYFFVGGMAGASAPLALVASLQGNRPLARAASAVALGGAAISPVLLISDLGRPGRFVNMLRVFKPTSPMSVGSWILASFGPAVGLGAARELLGILPRVGRAGQVAGAALGPGLSTYTAALLANTAVPAWHEARGELPFVFAGSSLASASGAALLLSAPADAGVARRMAVIGAAVSLGATTVMEGRLGELGSPYHEGGAAATVARSAKALTAAGGLLVAARARGGRRRPVLGALALLGGSGLERWAIFRAGVASAGDPAATVGPQRARRDERERAAQVGPVDGASA